MTITSQSTHFNSTKSPNVTAAPFNCKKCPNKPNKIPPLLYFYFYKQGFFPSSQQSKFKPAATTFKYMYTNLTSLHSCLRIQSGDHGWQKQIKFLCKCVHLAVKGPNVYIYTRIFFKNLIQYTIMYHNMMSYGAKYAVCTTMHIQLHTMTYYEFKHIILVKFTKTNYVILFSTTTRTA